VGERNGSSFILLHVNSLFPQHQDSLFESMDIQFSQYHLLMDPYSQFVAVVLDNIPKATMTKNLNLGGLK
jgi:hypothetical protein